MPYIMKMRDNKTGEVRDVPMPNEWCGDRSLEMWQNRMCDCNCRGFFHREVIKDQFGHATPEPHQARARAFGDCPHGGKRDRYVPITAVLLDRTEITMPTRAAIMESKS